MMKKLQYSQKVTLNKIEYKTARKKEEKTFSFLPIPCLNYVLFSSVPLPSRKREYLPFVLSEWVSCFGLDFSVYSSLLRISGFSLLLHLKHFLVSLSQTFSSLPISNNNKDNKIITIFIINLLTINNSKPSLYTANLSLLCLSTPTLPSFSQSHGFFVLHACVCVILLCSWPCHSACRILVPCCWGHRFLLGWGHVYPVHYLPIVLSSA